MAAVASGHNGCGGGGGGGGEGEYEGEVAMRGAPLVAPPLVAVMTGGDGEGGGGGGGGDMTRHSGAPPQEQGHANSGRTRQWHDHCVAGARARMAVVAASNLRARPAGARPHGEREDALDTVA